MQIRIFAIGLVLLFVTIQSSFEAPQCVDENGQSVDWFVLYKLPKLAHSNPKIAEGVAYLYITSEMKNSTSWTLSNYAITDAESIPGRTLSPLFVNEHSNDIDDVFWLLYNDQPPRRNYTTKYGHSKGIVIGTEDGGVWIVHSVPKFPDIIYEAYSYPITGRKFGQSFLCISMNAASLDEVGNQLIVNSVNTFNSSFSSNLKEKYPTLLKAAEGKRLKDRTSTKSFVSLNNVKFVSFAKSAKFGEDLYSNWVSEALEAELYVETWLHEDKLSSDCNETYPVHNIKNINFDSISCDFGNWHDHSKFAVSNDSSKPWICIGDINRASSQFTRGGGTVCTYSQELWLAYHEAVQSVEPCPKIREHEIDNVWLNDSL